MSARPDYLETTGRTVKVAVLFSGGKDSCFAVWVLLHQGWEITKLVSVRPSSPDSWMFHFPSVEWTRLQAQAMGLPHELVKVGAEEMKDLEHAILRMKEENGIEGVATGAVTSDYQKSRFDRMCDSVGLKSYSPLWHKRPEKIVDDLVQGGFQIIMTGVAASGLDDTWLGRRLTASNWRQLAKLSKLHGIHLTGEGGEYETFVLDAPHFTKAIRIEESKTVFKGQNGYIVIEKASLLEKPSN